LHTLEDPCSSGDRLLIHKDPSKLRKAASVLSSAYSSDDDAAIDAAELWLAGDSDVDWFDHKWNYWDQEQDIGALECLGWNRVVVETGRRYRASITKVAPESQR